MIEFHDAVFASPVFFRTDLPLSGGLAPGEGCDAVTWWGWGKLKMAQILKIKVQVLSIIIITHIVYGLMGKVYGLMSLVYGLIVWALSDLTWLPPPSWREKVMVYNIIIKSSTSIHFFRLPVVEVLGKFTNVLSAG